MQGGVPWQEDLLTMLRFLVWSHCSKCHVIHDRFPFSVSSSGSVVCLFIAWSPSFPIRVFGEALSSYLAVFMSFLCLPMSSIIRAAARSYLILAFKLPPSVGR